MYEWMLNLSLAPNGCDVLLCYIRDRAWWIAITVIYKYMIEGLVSSLGKAIYTHCLQKQCPKLIYTRQLIAN